MRRYAPADLPEIARWYAARGLKAPTDDMLSPYGMIVPGVAAGWLYRTDSSFALLDGYISNPAAPREERASALQQITDELLAEAFRNGAARVLAYTAITSIEDLALRSGFVPRGIRAAYERSL